MMYRTDRYDERRQPLHLSSTSERFGEDITRIVPRMPGSVELQLPFAHPAVGELAAARICPITVNRLREMVDLTDAQADLMRDMLGADNRSADRQIDSGGRIRFFGGACLVLQSPHFTIMTDPLITTADRTTAYTIDDLPDYIDLVLITAGRPDRTALETLLALRGRIGRIVVPRTGTDAAEDPSLRLFLERQGFVVDEAYELAEIAFPGGSVTATPHLIDDPQPAADARLTYLVRIADASVFIGADSSSADPALYRDLRRIVGKIDMAFFTLAGAWPSTPPQGDADCTVAMLHELGADELCVYGDASAPHDLSLSRPLPNDAVIARMIEIEKVLTWCWEHGILAEHLTGRREWRW